MNLDTMLEALRTRTDGVRLEQLEAEVWRRIEAMREPGRGVWAWRTAMAAVVLSVGMVAGGGAVASARADLSPFAVHTALAPSTLLGTSR